MSRFLLVHGVYHGPECWDAVAERLRVRGHECHAMALRGHGPDDRRVFDFSGVGYADYLDDVRQAVEGLGSDTILVGHSLGGMLVRSLIAEREVEGAVLLCMPTAAALRRGTALLLKRFPGATIRFLLTLKSEFLYHDPEIVPWLFWSCGKEDLPDPAWLERVMQFRQSRRLFWDVQWIRARRQVGNTPVHVVGGAQDFTLSEDGLEAAAAFHGASLRMIPGAPHDVMLTHPSELAAHLDSFAHQVAVARAPNTEGTDSESRT